MDGVTFTKWTPENVKKAVTEKLLGNAPTVGKFVEDDARRRLDAINTPDEKRDLNYRSYLSKWMLTNVVEVQGEALVIAIGTRIGKSGQRYHGWNIELGSPTIPAHPFLRPAVTQNARDIIQMLLGSS